MTSGYLLTSAYSATEHRDPGVDDCKFYEMFKNYNVYQYCLVIFIA